MGDAVVAAFFGENKPKPREKKRAEVESWLTGSLEAAWDKLAAMAATLRQSAHPILPFHWELEFPEVFARENGGFDAIVGNPPFMGGTAISENLGMSYFQFLKLAFPPAGHHCDLVAYFFRQAFRNLRLGGSFGLIATNTIAQGDTRGGGLSPILAAGGSIHRVVRRMRWPGEAAVIVSVVHVLRGPPHKQPCVDGRSVKRISAFLIDGQTDTEPFRLTIVPFFSLGSKIYGQGFVFDDKDDDASSIATMKTLVNKHPELIATRIFPYIGGEEVNSEPDHAPRRFVIYLSDVLTERELDRFPELRDIVREKVYPERMKLSSNPNSAPLKKKWWAYQAHRPDLYEKLRRSELALLNSQVSPHLAFCLSPPDAIYAHTLNVVPLASHRLFCTVQSRIHEVWARLLSSSMKDDLRYTPSDCFETFPLPPNFESSLELDVAGRAYYDRRAAFMVKNDEGMTKTYNRFHDCSQSTEDIQGLRALHAAMDRAVLEAYGWHDLAALAAPIFLDEINENDHTYQDRLFWPSDFRDEVLARLLALNAERHADEVRRGIAPGMKGKEREDDDELTVDEE
jgi:hypothetical protein